MINPFCDALEIARKTLFNDPNVHFRYLKKMPNGALAGFLPPNKEKGRDFPEIWMPAANTTRFSKPQKVMYSAFMGHEFLHYERSLWDLSTFKEWKEDGNLIAIDLAQFFEDVRIESGSPIALGIQEDIHLFREGEYKKHSQVEQEKKANAPLGWVMTCLQYDYLNIGHLKIPEGYQSYFDIAKEILDKDNVFKNTLNQKSEGHETVLRLSLEISKAWAEENDKDQGEEDENNDDQNDEEGTENPTEGSDPEEPAPGETEPDGENPDKNLQDLNEEYKNEEDSPVDNDSLKKFVQDMIEDPTNEEVQKQLRQIENIIDPSSKSIQPEFEPDQNLYVPYNAEDTVLTAPENEEHYIEMRNSLSSQIATMRSSISQIMVSRAQRETRYFQKRGKINPVHLYKVVTERNPNIRVQTRMEEDFNTGVSLVIDLSGSMSGAKVQTAAKVAMTFAEALQAVPMIKFEVLGYNCDSSKDKIAIADSDFTRKEKVNHWVFKAFDEPWSLVSKRLGSVQKSISQNGCVGGCNIDHENLNIAAKRLFDQDVNKRIMIVICDGIPNGGFGGYEYLLENELKAVVKKIKRNNIKLFCFGINSEKVRKFYEPDVMILKDINELNKNALNQLAKYMIR